MIPELGQACLILALALSLLPALLFKGRVPVVFGTLSAHVQFFLVAGAFALLTICFVLSDFSVRLVADNSHTLKPLFYKIAGAWGNHEGSMLLWVFVLTLCSALFSRTRLIDPDLKAKTLTIQSIITFFFLLFLVFTSNPFDRLNPPAIEGADLNPLLQDPGLIFHPPLLYIGYVGFSIVFSLAFAALLTQRVNADWARAIKPWVMFAWSALTAGIALGSWWAYYELGWGGFWFWDPVENASLMPWLLGTALLHSVLVLEKRGGFVRWSILLALLAFAFSMLGTFLVRSGVLTSVHAFAVDPGRGVLLLLIMLALTGSAFALLARDWPRYDHTLTLAPISRETMLALNNILLCTITGVVFTGTMYPLFLSALDAGAVAVGPPYFHATVFPFALPMMILMGIAALIPWKRGTLTQIKHPLMIICGIMLALVTLKIVLTERGPWLSIPAFAASAWLVVGSAFSFLRAMRSFGGLRYVPAQQWGMGIVHTSLGIAVIGMIGVGLWRIEASAPMKPGDTLTIGGYILTLDKLHDVFGPNYIAAEAVLSARTKENTSLALTLRPQKRHYPASDMTTTEADIHLSLTRDLYVVLGEPQPGGRGWAVKAWIHPFVSFLWLGFTGMALGGIISTLGARRALRIK